jgi:hypothetical protein
MHKSEEKRQRERTVTNQFTKRAGAKPAEESSRLGLRAASGDTKFE